MLLLVSLCFRSNVSKAAPAGVCLRFKKKKGRFSDRHRTTCYHPGVHFPGAVESALPAHVNNACKREACCCPHPRDGRHGQSHRRAQGHGLVNGRVTPSEWWFRWGHPFGGERNCNVVQHASGAHSRKRVCFPRKVVSLVGLGKGYG